MNRAEYDAKPRPPFRPSNEITSDCIATVTKREPLIRAEMERVTNMIHDGIDEARHLMERLLPILGASSAVEVCGPKPCAEGPVPPMVHVIRDQAACLQELVAIIKDASSRVEV